MEINLTRSDGTFRGLLLNVAHGLSGISGSLVFEFHPVTAGQEDAACVASVLQTLTSSNVVLLALKL